MEIATQYGQYWDMQAVSQYSIMHRLDDVGMLTIGQRWLEDRIAKLESGRIKARDHRTVERKMQEVDPGIRLRWEFDHPDSNDIEHVSMYAIDRYVPELGYYWTICYWSHRLGGGEQLRAILRDSDMQRPDYIEGKKLAQKLALERQEKKRKEMALASVDQLTLKRAQEFIAVEHALRSGEKIRSFGKDAEILNKIAENTKQNPEPLPGPEHRIGSRFRFGA